MSHRVLLVKKKMRGIFGYAEDILTAPHLSELYQLPIDRYSLDCGDVIVPRFNPEARRAPVECHVEVSS